MAEKEYIERDALLSAAKGYDWIAGLKTLMKRIPAADVRPVVKAKIVDMRYTEDDGEWKCSHCGRQFTLCVCGKDVTRKIHYCPNCGADMRGERDV